MFISLIIRLMTGLPAIVVLGLLANRIEDAHSQGCDVDCTAGCVVVGANICNNSCYGGYYLERNNTCTLLGNLALNKDAYQVNELNSDLWAKRAVDGNFTATYGVCSHTGSFTNPWWAVDLGQSFSVIGVNATNRRDWPVSSPPSPRLNHFIVGLTNFQPSPPTPITLKNYTICGQYPTNVSLGVTVYQPCPLTLQQYRYVIIQTNSTLIGDTYLEICELQVFGFGCDQKCLDGCGLYGRSTCNGNCTYGFGLSVKKTCQACDVNCASGCTIRGGGGCDGPCKVGFGLTSNYSCSDINECLTSSGNCSSNATCTNTDGSYNCVCNSGFVGNGFNCTDFNECLTYDGNCSTNATCKNTGGSYYCECNSGFAGDGFTCTDVNECVTNVGTCGPYAICTNTVGSFSCSCKEGFTGSGDACTVSATPSSQVTNSPGPTVAIIGGVVGGVLGAALVIGLVVLIVFLVRRGKREHEKGVNTTPDGHNHQSTIIRDKRPKSIVPAEYDQLPVLVGTMVKLEDLAAYIEHMKATTGYETQFSELPKDDLTKCVVGKRPENKKRNRFVNILPYDETRVKLFAREDDASEELYINGSIIKMDHDGSEVIATQAPKAETVSDFWEMIWQHNVSCIVALVLVYEDGKNRCHEYWPKSVGETSSSSRFTIKLLELDALPEFNRRKMSIQAPGKPPRTLTQFQYLQWPDKDVPEQVWSLTAFRNRVRRSISKASSSGDRLLVHCSAGVGRTGTFIALDILLDVAAQTGSVDVFEVVKNIRLQRMNSVQTRVQYELLYSAVFDAYVTGNTAHRPSELEYLRTELQNNGSHRTLETEYQKLTQTRPVMPHEDDLVALKPINIKKNQTLSVIPFSDSSRCLLSIGSDGTDYINASKALGYKMPNTYILTQLPLTSTIKDFWKMVVIEKCESIVILQPLTSAHPSFFPTKLEEAYEYGDTKVLLKSMKSVGAKKSTIVLHTMAVTGKVAGEKVKLEVRLHELSSWDENRNTPRDVEDVLELINLVNQWELRQQKASALGAASDRGRSVIVQCLDGATRSGLYAATSLAIDRLKCDNELDVFLSCRYITSVRPRTIISQAQYDFIYRAAIKSLTWTSSLTDDDKLLQASSGHEEHLYGNINPAGPSTESEGPIYANKEVLEERLQSVPETANQQGIYENIASTGHLMQGD